MKFTHATIYALRALVYMAEQKDSELMASHVVARATAVPERFLLKVLKPLVNARVLFSLKGPHGGYKLGKEPGDISLADVVEAVEGPIRSQVSFIGKDVNAGVNRKLQAVFDQANETIRRDLDKVSIADLASKKKGFGRVG